MGTATEHGVAEQAAAAASAAAARADVEILPIAGAPDSHRVSRLLSEIWAANPDQPLVPAEVIRSNAHVNGYGAMAVAGDDVVGAALGFFGQDDLRRCRHRCRSGGGADPAPRRGRPGGR